MSFRLFHCRDCDHHMRLNGHRCGFCGRPKPFMQQPVLIWSLTAMVTLLIVAMSLPVIFSTG